MKIELNPNIDLAPLQAEFQRSRRVRIDNILSPDSAEYILENLMECTAWHLVYSDQTGSPVRLNSDELNELDQQAYSEIQSGLVERASNSYQFIYKFFPIIDAIKTGLLPEASMLYQAATFTNSGEFIKFARKLTATDSLVKFDPQASLYEGGHFLNVHDDTSDQRTPSDSSIRRYAVVFGFTKNWSANWGGQTSFYPSPASPIAESWTPGFNTMSIFEVPSLHGVNYVTPFAAKGRYSITGWLRDDPSIVREDLGDRKGPNLQRTIFTGS